MKQTIKDTVIEKLQKLLAENKFTSSAEKRRVKATIESLELKRSLTTK